MISDKGSLRNSKFFGGKVRKSLKVKVKKITQGMNSQSGITTYIKGRTSLSQDFSAFSFHLFTGVI